MTWTVSLAGAARTAVRSPGAELSGWHPVELAGVVGQEVLERSRLYPSQVDEVVVGSADLVGANGADAARAVVLAAGWPNGIGGYGIDRAETSGAMAIHAAVAAIETGQAHTVVVIGLGLTSVVPPGASALNRTYGAPWGGVAERVADRGGLLPPPRLAEQAAMAAGVTRTDLDTAAEGSRRKRRACSRCSSIVAIAARPAGTGPGIGRGEVVTVDQIRDFEDPVDLPPAFVRDGLLTAATFSAPADAVSALLLRAGGPHMAAVVGTGRGAGDPFDPTGGVVTTVDKALRSGNLALQDMTSIAVVESSAAIPILVTRALGIDPERVNRSGGTLATGDAGAAEELRLVMDSLCELDEGELLLTISAGPTGSAATVWRRGPDTGGAPA